MINNSKGIVQRMKNQEVFHSHWTADILFLNVQVTWSLDHNEPISVA